VFENLIESKPKGTRTIGQTVMSVIVHALIIFGAVKATQGVAETIKNRPWTPRWYSSARPAATAAGSASGCHCFREPPPKKDGRGADRHPQGHSSSI
jgi:hypothetical protein